MLLRQATIAMSGVPADGPATSENCARRLCKQLIEQPWFDNVILVLIIVNCSILAVQTPTSGPAVQCVLPAADSTFNEDEHNCDLSTCEACQSQGDCSCNGPLQPGFDNANLAKAVEMAFTIAFTVEAASRIVATGFIMPEGAYLRCATVANCLSCNALC